MFLENDYVFNQKHNVHKIANFIVFSTLKEGGFFTSEKPPTLCITGNVTAVSREKRSKSPVPAPSPVCALKVPTTESGISVAVISPSASPASSMYSDDESMDEMLGDKDDYLFSTENVTPPAKAEGPFKPLVKIEGFKSVEKDKVVCSEAQKLLDKYSWKLMVKFDEKDDISLFVQMECPDEKWELKADVSIYVINESKKYESLDFSKYWKYIHNHIHIHTQLYSYSYLIQFIFNINSNSNSYSYLIQLQFIFTFTFTF